MHPTLLRRRLGFTLIELLTVIAVIGILAAIIIPTVGKVRETTQRTVDANNLRELAKAAAIYATENRDALPNPDQVGRTISGGEKYHQWFGQLAKYSGFNDPSMLVSKTDAAVDATQLPPSVMDPAVATNDALLAEFAALPATTFNVVGGLRLSDAATTPLAFTRGLRTDGTWSGPAATADDVAIGPYQQTGGHIVFLGGNVQFYSNVNQALIANNGKTTSNLREAVPNRSTVKIYGRDSGNGVASDSGQSALAGP
jgi:prepilin-type N-terminal cleavage/methylation domain-containing protein